jgi:hypothetical protein
MGFVTITLIGSGNGIRRCPNAVDRAKILRSSPSGKRSLKVAPPEVDAAAGRPEVDAPVSADAARSVRTRSIHQRACSMRYLVMTHVSPDDVIRRAREYFAANTLMDVADESDDMIRFEGDIGMAAIRVDREHGHTNVHAETDRVVGLDVTDITKRFLYTLEHV